MCLGQLKPGKLSNMTSAIVLVRIPRDTNPCVVMSRLAALSMVVELKKWNVFSKYDFHIHSVNEIIFSTRQLHKLRKRMRP